MPMRAPPAPEVACASELMPPERMQMIEKETAKFEKRTHPPLEFLRVAHVMQHPDVFMMVVIGIA